MKEQRGFLNMIKLGVILALFAAGACVMLAFVYSGTLDIITRQKKNDRKAAQKELFPEADQFTPIQNIKSPDPSVVIEPDDKKDPEDTGAYQAFKNGEVIGVVLRVSRASYGGPIKTMVGVSIDGIITGVKIMEHKDTPGLGAYAASPAYFVDRERGITFYGQFAGKKTSDPFEVKKDVAAITASTITSQAVAASVKAAGISAIAWLAGVDAAAVVSPSTGGTK